MDNPNIKQLSQEARQRGATPAFSLRLPDGGLAELLFDPAEEKTRFAVWRNNETGYEPRLSVGTRLFVPYSPHNSLLEHNVILVPSAVEAYQSEEALLTRIRDFLHRYVDVSPAFERLASYYVLLTWIYEDFSELPYLRVRGDAGSGKTRFLLTLGSMCYKPIFATGASTASPLFRILDMCRGTLVIDESDFRYSDEKTEIVKILNQGHARGFPVLRTESDNKREFSPRAYQVFGPKIVATRGLFEDRALESRCVTEVLGGKKLRRDVPISLTEDHQREAREIRNQLLLFRFRHLGRHKGAFWIDHRLEPRLNQVFSPLMSVIDDPKVQDELRQMAYSYQEQLISDRGLDSEAQLLEVIRDMQEHDVVNAGLSIKGIASRFSERFSEEYERKITPRWIGGLIRQKLGLATERRHGNYFIAALEKQKLARLYEQYGLTQPPEVAEQPEDIGTMGRSPEG